MKICRKCGEEKEEGLFYRNKRETDGRNKWCKICLNTCIRAGIKKNPEKRRKIARESHHKHKDDLSQQLIPWAPKPYDIKMKARRKLQSQVRQGRIVRQPCETCGLPNGDAHHDDYTRPLDVKWFCKLCHAAYHREHPEISE